MDDGPKDRTGTASAVLLNPASCPGNATVIGLGEGGKLVEGMERAGTLPGGARIITFTHAHGPDPMEAEKTVVEPDEQVIFSETRNNDVGITSILSRLFGRERTGVVRRLRQIEGEGDDDGNGNGSGKEDGHPSRADRSEGWLDRPLIARNPAYTRLRATDVKTVNRAMEAVEGPGMLLVVSDLDDESLDTCLLLDALSMKFGKRDTLFLVQPGSYRNIWTVQHLNGRIQEIARCADSVLMAPPVHENNLMSFIEILSSHLNMVSRAGTVNIDLADVKHIAGYGNIGVMGVGRADGKERALRAAKRALSHPMMDIDVTGIDRAIVCVNGGEDMTIEEAESTSYYISRRIREGAKIIWGANVSPELNGSIEVVLLVGVTPHQALLHHYAGT